jgi:acetate kinase
LRAAIAAMVAGLGGLDALVFTGGVGENAPTVRAAAVAGLGFLDVALDAPRNDRAVGAAAAPEADITADGSTVRTLVVAAREDLEIARGVRARLR